MTKKLLTITAATASLLALSALPMSAYAATPEEACAVARSYGISEETIQQCWNEYYENPELYPPEVIDDMIAQLHAKMGGINTTVAYDPTATSPITTATTAAGDSTSGDDKPVKDDSITLTMPDGSTFTRISAKDFIALTYEQKQQYLSTFTPEQQAVIMNNLSPEEYRNLLKQMPVKDKTEIVGGLANIAGDLGLNVGIDEITDDNIVLSVINKDGELVGVSTAKETVENTGYDYRALLAGALALVIAGVSGMLFMAKGCFKKDENGVG